MGNLKFIYFIDAALKGKVLNEGILLRPNQRKINEESTGIFCYPMIKIPFKAPVSKEDDLEDYLAFEREENLLNASLTIEESWEVVGAFRARKDSRNLKKVLGIIFELEPKHWPITVFIDIRHFIANKFGQILYDDPNEDIIYGYKNSLLETVKKIESKRYVLSSTPFTINTVAALIDLIGKFQQAGGGIWKEDSFECMLLKEISGSQIQQVVELEGRYNNTIVKHILE